MLGERLQYLRLEKGMTQKELSKVFKVSLKTIQFYEQNRTIPDIYLVAEMAKFFNVSCDYILGVVKTIFICQKSLWKTKKQEEHIKQLWSM